VFRSALLASAALAPLAAYAAPGAYPTPTFNDVITPADPRYYGAKCDGAAHVEDDAAWAALAAAATAGSSVFVPGQCVFTVPIVFPVASQMTFYAEGFGGAMIYSGAAANADLITFGSSTGLDAQHCSARGLKIKNVRFRSTTVMTGGDAVRIKYACDSDLQFNNFGDEVTGGNHFWNALHLDSGNSVRVVGGDINGKNVGVVLNGDATFQLTDPYFFHVKIAYANVGMNVAGGVGGLQLTESALIGNGTHVRISQDQVAKPNLQLMIGATLDITNGGAGVGVDLADPGTTNSLLMIKDAWLATAVNQCLLIEPGALNWQVTMQGGYVLNCNNTATKPAMVENQSTSAAVNLQFIGTQFSQCCNGGTYAIKNAVGANPVRLTDVTFLTTTLNRVSGPFQGTWNDGGTQIVNAKTAFLAGLGSTAADCGVGVTATLVQPYKMDGSSPGCPMNLGSGAAQWADIEAIAANFGSYVRVGITTVAALPACTASTRGMIVPVGDATAPTYRGALTGGGAVGTLAYCDNGVWTAH
jgi:hypothetical protein